VPATLTYPGKVLFVVKVTAKGARTGDAVADIDNANATVERPDLTVTPDKDKQFSGYAFAEDFKGSGSSQQSTPSPRLTSLAAE
jgi:hypothetical protein